MDSVRLVGKGAQGCVVQPAIQSKYVKIYKDYDNAKDDDIGKLFKAEKTNSFKVELQILETIQGLDPNNEYTVAFKGANVIRSTDIISEEGINNCLFDKTKVYTKVKDTKSKTKSIDGKTKSIEDSSDKTNNGYIPIYQIVYEYGGKELSDVKEASIPFSKFIRMIIQFLKGIQNLHRQKIIHRDIKPANVLVNDSKINLIDFGLYEYADKVFLKYNERVLSYPYRFYPPDFYIASQLLSYSGNKSEFQEKLETMKNSNINDDLFYQKLFRPQYLNNTIAPKIKEFIGEIISKDLSYDEVFNEKLAYKCDIYSLSFVFSVFSRKILYSQNVDAEKKLLLDLNEISSEINPFKRASINSMLNLIKPFKYDSPSASMISSLVLTSPTKSASKSITTAAGGGRKIRLYFPKKYKDNCNEIKIPSNHVKHKKIHMGKA